MPKGGDTKDSTLDLGLSALLSSAAPESSEKESEVPVHSDEAQPEAVEEITPPLPKSTYELLAESGQWRELVAESERALSNGDEFEPRLWWIRGHLEGGSMPVSFLAAPFDGVCTKLEGSEPDESIRSLLTETGRALHVKLEAAEDTDHAPLIAARLSAFGIAVTPDQSGNTKPKEVTFDLPASEVDKNKGALVSAAVFSAPTGMPRAGREQIARGTKLISRPYVLGVTALVVVGLGATYFMGLSTPFSLAEVSLASERFVQAPHDPQLVIPVAQRRDPVGSLSALYYYIDDAVAPSQQEVSAPVVNVSSQSGPAAPELPSDGVEASKDQTKLEQKEPLPNVQVAKVKERINTKGPVEGAEFRERQLRYENSPPALKAPERIGPPILENASKRRIRAGGIHFVIARTTVLSEPTYGGKVLSHLNPGDRVFVEARLGRWLRIKSVRGRGGFVLAEDVGSQDRASDGGRNPF